MDDSYSTSTHRFRFAAWAAGRASGRGLAGFTGETATSLLKTAGLEKYTQGLEALPAASKFDKVHQELCSKIISSSSAELELSYGRAAKLVNVYFKSLFLNYFGHPALTGEQTASVNAIHPPIDFLLLNAMSKHEDMGANPNWKIYAKQRWTKFNQTQYQAVIEEVRTVTDGRLWEIEKYWKGFQ